MTASKGSNGGEAYFLPSLLCFFFFLYVECRIGVLQRGRIGVHTAENVFQVRVCQYKPIYRIL